MNANNHPYRAVVEAHEAANGWRLTLACGHVVHRPHDAARVRCEECESSMLFAANV